MKITNKEKETYLLLCGWTRPPQLDAMLKNPNKYGMAGWSKRKINKYKWYHPTYSTEVVIHLPHNTMYIFTTEEAYKITNGDSHEQEIKRLIKNHEEQIRKFIESTDGSK